MQDISSLTVDLFPFQAQIRFIHIPWIPAFAGMTNLRYANIWATFK